MVDLLVLGGTVVTMDSRRRRIRDGAVAIEGNEIIHVGEAGELKRDGADIVIHAEGDLVLPGFVDTHTHSQSTITSLRGYGLEAPGGGLYQRLMTIRVKVPEEERYYLAMGGCLSALRFGTTTVADWDFGENETARAVRDTGLRGLLSEYVYGIDFHETRDAGTHVFSQEEADRTLAAGLKLVDDWHGEAGGRITCSLGPHAPDTCPPELLSRIREDADGRGLRINTHLAQSREELRYVEKMYGKTPVEYLRDEGILGDKTFVAHCTHITDDGVEALRETDTKICVCPRVYARRGGSTALMKFLEAGCTVGLGTDGGPDMVRYMESAIIASAFRRTFLGEVPAPDAQRVLELATIDAAGVLGMEGEVGSLEEGKKADVIIVDMKRPHMIPNVDPVANLVYYGSGSDVRTVIIDGEVVMEDWTVRTVDESEVLARTQRAAEDAWLRYYPDTERSDLFQG